MQAHELFKHAWVPELGDVRQYVRTLPTNTTLMGLGAFAAITTYWYATRPKALKPPSDMAMQSVEVKSCPQARRSVLLDTDEPLTYYYDDVTTVYEIFQRGLRISRNEPCLGRRKSGQPYEWITYQEVSDRAERIGSALLFKGCRAASDQYIGIYSQNRPEWVIVELGCYTYSMVVVPLYDTLGAEAIKCIINQAQISIVFCDNTAKANALLDSCEQKTIPSLHYIVVMDSQDIHLRERGKNCGVEVHCMHALEQLGETHRESPKPPKTDDLAIICFTSGTTGRPKGAMLTHKNIVSDFSGFLKVTEKGVVFPGAEDVLISFLPLAHMFERVVETVLLAHGGRIGFFQGEIKLLMDDLKTLQPTIFPVVPRLLNKMYDHIYSQASNAIKKWILDFAAKRKGNELRNGVIRNNSIWDKLIFKKVQAAIGGKVRLMITGAAPVSVTVLMFMRAAVGCQFYEGYGQTECTAGCTMNVPGDWTAGHVGAPMPCNIVKLIDVEDMNYSADKGEGEVCVKGPNVFLGYLNDPDNTAEALDGHGWLHTGDIGQWLPNGTLKIVDRRKHIFKLQHGEYIAPEKIENIYVRSEPVTQVFVHGESVQAYLVAVVVPDPDTFVAWAKKKNFEGSYAQLCKNKGVKNAVMEDLVRLGNEAGLKSFEQVKDIILHDEMFSIENGLLTPTMKAKRTEIRKRFQPQIDEMYAKKKV